MNLLQHCVLWVEDLCKDRGAAGAASDAFHGTDVINGLYISSSSPPPLLYDFGIQLSDIVRFIILVQVLFMLHYGQGFSRLFSNRVNNTHHPSELDG